MRWVLCLVLFFWLAGCASAAELRVAVTTSFNNSGLSEILLPAFEQDTGVKIHLLVVGTGQALKLGRQGDVDAILVHSRSAEEAFVSEGFATHRREIMYNDFVLVGPKNDPAGIANVASAKAAFARISGGERLFVSRGDDSGTHRKELLIWEAAGLDPESRNASWYRSVGAGMGAALNAAAGMDGYILSDRASWLNYKNKRDLSLLFSGDPALFNQYAFLPINPARHSHVKSELAEKLENWLVSSKGQALIDGYEIDGEKLFTANAKADDRGS